MQNGNAERYVGLMKHLATELMLKTSMPVEAWLWAMKNAAHTYRCNKLGIKLPAPLPQFGERVLVRRSNIKKNPAFTLETDDGIFLGWNPEVVQGGDVLIWRVKSTLRGDMFSPKPWPNRYTPTSQRWRLLEGPDGEKLWLSNKRWNSLG